MEASARPPTKASRVAPRSIRWSARAAPPCALSQTMAAASGSEGWRLRNSSGVPASRQARLAALLRVVASTMAHSGW
ncbi:hypothetical protein CR165_08550 [Pseudoroseomonas aestuarii]|uniref:Uncharacterized protein n=1 Tax=Teichococcus aestuarii TaxID=568898 RepID=A0A2U1V5P7_9PROT|nr:hypothetical protein CR165_08550 [Pseudoroseomonas aestuarii]